MDRVLTWTCCLLLGVLLAGCEKSAEISPQASPDRPAAVAAVHASPVSAADGPKTEKGHVQFEHASTTKLISVVGIETERVGKGLLRVTLNLQNSTNNKLWTDISTVFYDAKGKQLEQTTWQPTLLKDRATTEYTCTSLFNQAADYRIIIRRPNRSSLDVP